MTPFRGPPSERDTRLLLWAARVAAWVVVGIAVLTGVGQVRERLRAGPHTASHTAQRATLAPGLSRTDLVPVPYSGVAGAAPAAHSSEAEETSAPKDTLRETYIPVWEVAVRHPERVMVDARWPLVPCDSSTGAGAPDGRRQPGYESETLALSLTREPFDSIAAREGFHRREGRWVTVDARGHVMDATEIGGASWRGLKGGRVGAPAPRIPVPGQFESSQAGLGPQDRVLATVAHPRGCTLVLSYYPPVDGGGDSLLVRQMVESVRLGAAAAETALFPRASTDSASTDSASTASDAARAEPAPAATPGDTARDTASRDSASRDAVRRDLGIGLAFFARDTADSGPPGGSGQPANTIIVYRDPHTASRVLARLTGDADGPLTLHTAGPVAARTVEHGYEAEGVPVLEFSADSAWMRVLYGIDTTSAKPQTGWVRRGARGVGFASWTDLLEARTALFFMNDVREEFYATPGGRRVDASAVGGWIHMDPLATQGPWMLVRVMSPSDYCDVTARKARYSWVWVRALDDRGRPRLGYPSRGC